MQNKGSIRKIIILAFGRNHEVHGAAVEEAESSNAIRTLSAFAGEKLVAIDGRKIKFMNLQGLEKISRIG